jgi:hypothetical protein
MDLSTIVDVLSIVAVVSGLIFAGIELRQSGFPGHENRLLNC